jgi:hypothetical protein
MLRSTRRPARHSLERALKTGIPYGQVKFVCSAAGAKQAPAELTLF